MVGREVIVGDDAAAEVDTAVVLRALLAAELRVKPGLSPSLEAWFGMLPLGEIREIGPRVPF